MKESKGYWIFFTACCITIVINIVGISASVYHNKHKPTYPIIIHDTETVTVCERDTIRVFHIKPKLKVNPYEL